MVVLMYHFPRSCFAHDCNVTPCPMSMGVLTIHKDKPNSRCACAPRVNKVWGVLMHFLGVDLIEPSQLS